jgi:HSP20 family molecular chaperone IbpA
MKDREVAGWMWAEACSVIQQAERLHREFFRVGLPRGRAPAWEPPVDIFETDEVLMISAALPGVAAENIQVVIEGDVLTIAGARLLTEPDRTALIHRLEIPYGRFERRIRLPAGPLRVVRNQFVNGCLELTLQRR